MYVDALMNEGRAADWGITGVGLLPGDRAMLEVMAAQDCLYTLVVKNLDGSIEPRVIGSIVDYLFAPDEPEAVLERMADPATRIVSLTITEGGYHVNQADGVLRRQRPRHPGRPRRPTAPPTTAFGFITEALARRRDGRDRAVHGDVLRQHPGQRHVARDMITAFATLRDAELGALDRRARRASPTRWSTGSRRSRPTRTASCLEQEYGVEDGWPVVCEPFTQWALEDNFPLGRPDFEGVGVQVVDDVEPYELMKLRLLNASHQALCYLGYLSGYRYAHEVAATRCSPTSCSATWTTRPPRPSSPCPASTSTTTSTS